jgi:hypothetical protein
MKRNHTQPETPLAYEPAIPLLLAFPIRLTTAGNYGRESGLGMGNVALRYSRAVHHQLASASFRVRILKRARAPYKMRRAVRFHFV